MKVFPAVDILDGRCVQLVQGRREDRTEYGDPLACAERWIEEGAYALHVINLNGAFGNSAVNAAEIKRIIDETGVFIQLGGGIRSMEDAGGWLEAGVDRVILGTAAVRNPAFIAELSEEFGGDTVMAGVDARSGSVVVDGWDCEAGDYITWAKKFEELGAGSLLYTNVDVEGLCRGISISPVKRLIENTHLPITVSGGITSIEDIKAIKSLGGDGVVLGSALYRGIISMKEVLEVSR